MHPAATDNEPRDAGVGADLGTEAAGRPCDRFGDSSHSAFGVSPAAELAVADVADRVVRHDVSGAGLTGPAQVPITPLTASAPLICGDSNQSSSRSAMLIVSSRVTSAVVRTGSAALAPRQSCQVDRSTADASRCWAAPGRSGPITSAMPSNEAFHFGHASASFLDHLASCS